MGLRPSKIMCVEYADWLSKFSDICSFYKEEIMQERTNLVHDRATVTGTSVTASLTNIANELMEATTKTRLILDGVEERKAWENFISGYLAFFAFSSRYRFHEIKCLSDIIE